MNSTVQSVISGLVSAGVPAHKLASEVNEELRRIPGLDHRYKFQIRAYSSDGTGGITSAIYTYANERTFLYHNRGAAIPTIEFERS